MVHLKTIFPAAAFTILLFAASLRGQQRETASAVPKSNPELKQIWEEDQRNRTDQAGDVKRRERIRGLLGAGRVNSGDDYFYAAFIFQHGQKPNDYLFAHILAVTAAEKGCRSAIWLAAATLDRYLQSIKRPQLFGTQFGDTQEPYDRKMVSDDLRKEWCVAPYSTQIQILKDIKAGKEFTSTRTCPLP